MAISTTSSSTPLSLFPSPSSTFPLRSASIKRIRAQDHCSAPPLLHGVAVQVTSARPVSSTRVQPAGEKIKHSLFCDPKTGVAVQSTAPPRQNRRRFRSSRDSSIATGLSPLTRSTAEDQLAPLSLNTQCGHSSSSKRSAPPKMPKRSDDTEQPPPVSYRIAPDHDYLSASAEKARLRADWAEPSDCPTALSRPNSTISIRHDEGSAHRAPHSPGQLAPMRSMFPQYDPTKSLNQQCYFPAHQSPPPAIPIGKLSKDSSPIERLMLQESDTGLALVDGYEHIPFANSSDLIAIWKASRGEYPIAGRKIRFNLLQPRQGTSIAIGRSQKDLLYTMGSLSPSSPSYLEKSGAGKQLFVERHGAKVSPAPVASLILPKPGPAQSASKSQTTFLFPQQAAIHAVEAITNSPVAAEIATFDPKGTSLAATRLAQDAIATSHRNHGCELVRATRRRDSLGSVTAFYNLEHPSLGTFALTVTKAYTQSAVQGARAKICLHHPSATPAAIAAETLVLAFLDFARDACVLDLPGLVSLESPYLVDIGVMAMLTVAAIENDALMTETITFAPPPKTAIKAASMKSGGKKTAAKKVESRRSKIFKKAKDEIIGEQVELPILTQGALSLVGFSLKTALVLVEVGVKVTAGVIVGASRVVRKM